MRPAGGGGVAMATTLQRDRGRRPLWATRNGVLLAAAIVSSAIAWWMIAWPVASLSNVASHRDHFALTFAHMLGGSGMLFFGTFNLYLAGRIAEWGKAISPSARSAL